MQIFVKNSCGKNICLDVTHIIEAQTLENGRTIDSYGFHEKGIINAVPRLHGGSVLIFIRSINDKFDYVNCPYAAPVEHMKKEFAEKTGVITESMDLIYNSVILNDDTKIGSIEIEGFSTLCLIPKYEGNIQIHVQSTRGDKWVIKTSSQEIIANLKVNICELSGLKVDKIRLMYRNVILDDDCTVESCGLKMNAKVSVFCQSYTERKINFKTTNGKSCSINALPQEIVKDLKVEVRKKLGFKEEIKLVHKGGRLSNDSSLEECGITDEAIVYVIPEYRGVQVYVRTPDARIMKIDICLQDTVDILKLKIATQHRAGPSANNMRLECEGTMLKDGWTLQENGITDRAIVYVYKEFDGDIEITIRSSVDKTWKMATSNIETIGELKVKICELSGFKFGDIKLKHQNLTLDDDCTVEVYEIKTGSEVSVIQKSFTKQKINFKTLCGKECIIEALPEEKFNDLKSKITNNLLLKEEFKLVHEGKRLSIDSSIDECDIKDRAIVNVVPVHRGTQVYVRTMDAIIITIDISLQDVVELLKLKIATQHQTEINVNGMRLMHEGTILEDGRTLDEYDITDQAILYLYKELLDMEVFVKVIYKETVTIETSSQEIVGRLKARLCQTTQMHPESIVLLYKGSILDESSTINKCEIQSQTTLYVCDPWSVSGLKINLANHEPFQMKFCCLQSIKELKNCIGDILNINTEKATLKYDGKELEEDKSIMSFHIFYGSLIYLIL